MIIPRKNPIRTLPISASLLIRLTSAIVLLSGSLILKPAAAQSQGAFVPLLDGNDLSGWVEMGEPGAFTIENGTLFLERPTNYPNWLRSDEQYENFELELEYQAVGWAEGGIYIHAPLHGNPLKSGIKIHLRHDRTEEGARSTGALYDIRAPITIANDTGDAWNRLRIHVDWPRLRVTLNDALIHDVHMERSDALRWRLRKGYIGFEDSGTRFRFRNIRIRELPATEPAWASLFNGRDLDGWESQSEGEAEWSVADGKIVAGGGDGVLRTTRTFSGFEFQTYFRATPHANGGIFYRLMDRGADLPGHYEIQIYNVPTATNPTGSIYGIVPAADAGCRSGEWCLMQLISDGAYSRVLINGTTVAEANDLALPDSGAIAIQNHSDGTIEYKGLRVKPIGD